MANSGLSPVFCFAIMLLSATLITPKQTWSMFGQKDKTGIFALAETMRAMSPAERETFAPAHRLRRDERFQLQDIITLLEETTDIQSMERKIARLEQKRSHMQRQRDIETAEARWQLEEAEATLKTVQSSAAQPDQMALAKEDVAYAEDQVKEAKAVHLWSKRIANVCHLRKFLAYKKAQLRR